jgi:hypothetical protein
MAKQIKVIKCPQCGNSKPTAIDKDHYRCGKCDTEFILDSDDVNINVNHRYEQEEIKRPALRKGGGLAILIIFITIFILVIGTNIVTRVFRQANRPVTTSSNPPLKASAVFSTLLLVDGQAVAFNLENKGGKGYSAVFYDIVNTKKIKELNGLFEDEKIREVSSRKFQSDDSHYVIINDSYLYKITTDAFINMEAEISSRKPALNSGYSKISFTPDETGEGFALTTNLGKDFYYFPASDDLYTEKALDYVIQGKMQTVSDKAINQVYYLFRNKESKQSSNVAELLEITYKYNNGGPENKLLNIEGNELNRLEDYRIISYKPITEERICFSPDVLFYDKENILITYKETLAENSKTNIQLLDTKGTVVWTISIKQSLMNVSTIRTNRGFMLQNKDASLYEISTDGKTIQNYKLP